jgi:hypothetical protein
MIDKNKLTKTEEGPALHEVATSELQATVGGHVEVYRAVSYPAAGYPWPSPWLTVVQQQYVIGI